MIKYSNFLFSVIFRRASTYISAFFCLLASFIFIYLNVVSNNDKGNVGIFPITLFTTWFPFLFSTMFVALMVIRIFKIGESDGTELLIFAKPITRGQIIFGKFLVLFAMILILHGLLFILYIILALIDDKASGKWRILFATSMTLGGLIVTIISSSLIVIISSIIGKVGVAVISIIFSSCIPIVSYIIVPVSDATSPLAINRTLKNNSLGDLYLMNKDKNNTYNPEEEIYSKGYNILKNKHLLIINNNKKSWYKYGSFADIWYQWGRLFTMLEPKVRPNLVLGIIAKKASVEHIDLKLLKAYEINLGSIDNKSPTRYRLALFSKEEIELEKAKLTNIDASKYQALVKKNGKLNELFLSIEDEEIGQAFEKKLGLIPGTIENNKSLLRILIYRLVMEYQRNNPNKPELSNIDRVSQFMMDDSGEYYSRIKDMKYYENATFYAVIKNYKEEPWLATIPVVLVWSFLALGLLGLSMLIYFKRDFK